mmetsp:Transcript_9896/g.41908  ORF Transcript_9896/g.41908 Transcript_9896/m.41908 type:complete len:227 (+) Transcript_9896:833-1513(+)
MLGIDELLRVCKNRRFHFEGPLQLVNCDLSHFICPLTVFRLHFVSLRNVQSQGANSPVINGRVTKRTKNTPSRRLLQRDSFLSLAHLMKQQLNPSGCSVGNGGSGNGIRVWRLHSRSQDCFYSTFYVHFRLFHRLQNTQGIYNGPRDFTRVAPIRQRSPRVILSSQDTRNGGNHSPVMLGNSFTKHSRQPNVPPIVHISTSFRCSRGKPSEWRWVESSHPLPLLRS